MADEKYFSSSFIDSAALNDLLDEMRKSAFFDH